MKKFTRRYFGKIAGVATGTAVAFVALPSFAAVDAGVTTAIATGVTDTQTVAWAVVALIVGISAIKYVRRAL